MRTLAAVTLSVLALSCRREAADAPPPPAAEPSAPAEKAAPPGGAGTTAPGTAEGEKVQSDDILARPAKTENAEVKHVLIGWRELAPNYRGQMDARAGARNKAEASALAAKVLARLRGGEAIDPIMKELSEDPGSAATGQSYTATPDAPLVPEFKALSLRLDVGEAGIVETRYGWHVIQRVR